MLGQNANILWTRWPAAFQPNSQIVNWLCRHNNTLRVISTKSISVHTRHTQLGQATVSDQLSLFRESCPFQRTKTPCCSTTAERQSHCVRRSHVNCFFTEAGGSAQCLAAVPGQRYKSESGWSLVDWHTSIAANTGGAVTSLQ